MKNLYYAFCRSEYLAVGLSIAVGVIPLRANAHATGQNLVALLPTGPYTAVGVSIVALSIILLLFLPSRSASQLLPSRKIAGQISMSCARFVSSVFFFLLICWGCLQGFTGTRDPLENPLVLGFWLAFWVVSPIVQGYLFDLWAWISPWSWASSALDSLKARPILRLPRRLGVWPAVVLLFGFSTFTLADPAPDNPERLATVVLCYVTLTLVCMAIFGGRRWLEQAEFFSVLMVQFGQLAIFGQRGKNLYAGCPSWQLANRKSVLPGIPIFILVLLGTGSFDGFNETFFWLNLIGVNPLEFPGRSAVVIPVVVGLISSNMSLVLLFVTMIAIGDRLVLGKTELRHLVHKFAPTILPIALAYHTAHYLPSLLVDGQYVLLAFNDPLNTGANLLGLEGYYVTTGFFNHRETMRAIWLGQALVIVFGHVIGVILAHTVSVELYGNVQTGFRAGVPLGIFMVLYTWLGLWLLASPKGG
jgi:hypothetical protein